MLAVHRQLDRRLSQVGVWVMRRTNGRIAKRYKVSSLVLTTVGRKSGRARPVVLQFFPDGDAMIVAATNDGGPSLPAWYLNSAATPTAHVEVDGRRIAVTSSELPGDDAVRWWPRILEHAPGYTRYTQVAGRTFPIVRLCPVRPIPEPLRRVRKERVSIAGAPIPCPLNRSERKPEG